MIIVSTFLARSPTSYGRGFEVFSSREPQSPAPPVDYDLGGERDHMSLQQDSMLDMKSSDSEFLMTEQPASNTPSISVKPSVPARSFVAITKNPLS